METQWQILYFLACALMGVIGGVIWQLLSFPEIFFQRKKNLYRWIGFAVDVLFFVAFGVVCTLVSAHYSFPWQRPYMCVGYALGLIISSKSMKILLDFSKKVCYNTFNKLSKRRKGASKRGEENV